MHTFTEANVEFQTKLDTWISQISRI